MSTTTEKNTSNDRDPAIITDHKFSPRAQWWSLCGHCGLAQAAHAESELEYYGDDNPD